MQWTIKNNMTDDWESCTLFLDDEEIASVGTSYDAPEDNSCSRLGIAGAFASILATFGEKADIVDTEDEEY